MPFRSYFSRHNNERGAAAVEFALIAGILFMMLFGIIEFGRIFSEMEVLNSAAREGARVAAVRGTSTQIQTAVANAADPYELDGTPMPDKVCSDTTAGEPVTVSWEQTFTIEVGILPPLDRDIEVKGVFRCE